MKSWLILGILAYLSYAISSSIDKTVMNRDADALSTNTLKCLLDGILLLVLGLVSGVSFESSILIYSAVLGGLMAFSGVVYFKLLHEMDVDNAVPVRQSASTLLIFALSVLLLSETVSLANAVGGVLASAAIFMVMSDNPLKLPDLNLGVKLLGLSTFLGVSYSLLVKVFVADISVIALSSTMYFFAAGFQGLYHLKFRSFSELETSLSQNFGRISIAAVFGASGTFLLYSALKIGEASQVYPLTGIQSVFILIFATLFLDEKATKWNILGIFMAFVGIYLVQL